MKSLLLFFLLLTTASAFAQGWGDWQHETPGGNTMRDAGSGAELSLSNGKDIVGIKNWYFYHDHVIGESYDGFFMADERGGTIERFATRPQWQAAIERRSLTPFLWTRWYHDNWGFYEGTLLPLFLFWILPLGGLLLLVYMVRLAYSTFVETEPVKAEAGATPSPAAPASILHQRSSYRWLGSILAALAVWRLLLDLFPQSL